MASVGIHQRSQGCGELFHAYFSLISISLQRSFKNSSQCWRHTVKQILDFFANHLSGLPILNCTGVTTLKWKPIEEALKQSFRYQAYPSGWEQAGCQLPGCSASRSVAPWPGEDILQVDSRMDIVRSARGHETCNDSSGSDLPLRNQSKSTE